MFAKDDKVQVYSMRPGQFEHSWHPATIVGKVDATDTYTVLLDGDIPVVVKTSDIKRA